MSDAPRERSPTGFPPLYVARDASGALHAAPRARDLLAVAVPRRTLDPVGLAGLLWRGAPLDARLPLRGVASAPVAVDVATRTARTRPLDVERAAAEALAGGGAPTVLLQGGVGSRALLVLARRALGSDVRAVTLRFGAEDAAAVAEAARFCARHRVDHVVLGAEPARPEDAWREHLETFDLPSADGFLASLAFAALARAGVSRLATAAGAASSFGTSPPVPAVALGARRPSSRRARAPADALDLAARRDAEGRALARAPMHAVAAAVAAFPAATRDALAFLPPRPPDGIVPRARGTRGALEVLRRGALADGGLRDLADASARAGVTVLLPFLDARFVRAVEGLPTAARFGRPGGGGWLAHVAGPGDAPRVRGFPAHFEALARGPLAAALAAALAPARLRAQDVLRADSVTEATARWRADAAGWTAREIAFLATISAWIERDELVREAA